MIFEPEDSHLLFTGLCALPILLSLKLMVATLRASEIKGLDGEAKTIHPLLLARSITAAL